MYTEDYAFEEMETETLDEVSGGRMSTNTDWQQDTGAYTAQSQGRSNTVQAYCEACKKMTTFRIASGGRGYCTVCNTFKFL